MKSMILVALALVAVAVAVPVEVEPVRIVKSNFDQSPEGSYNYAFESEDGTAREETGEVKQVLDADNKPVDVVVVRGSYSYTNSEGVKDFINYVADELGFRAEGPSVPKAERR